MYVVVLIPGLWQLRSIARARRSMCLPYHSACHNIELTLAEGRFARGQMRCSGSAAGSASLLLFAPCRWARCPSGSRILVSMRHTKVPRDAPSDVALLMIPLWAHLPRHPRHPGEASVLCTSAALVNKVPRQSTNKWVKATSPLESKLLGCLLCSLLDSNLVISLD